jgi:hypothetical protein
MTEIRGNCFEVAMQLLNANTRAVLCHGVREGSIGDGLSLRCWHAWIEVDPGDSEVLCIDRSNGQQTTMRQSDYYERGRVNHVTRYERDQARSQWNAHRHMGPWAEPPELVTLLINPGATWSVASPQRPDLRIEAGQFTDCLRAAFAAIDEAGVLRDDIVWAWGGLPSSVNASL